MMTRTRLGRAARLLAILAVLVWAAPALRAAWQQPGAQTEAAREGYVPMKDLPAAEQLPAAPLVLGAYAVIWLGVLVYSRRSGAGRASAHDRREALAG